MDHRGTTTKEGVQVVEVMGEVMVTLEVGNRGLSLMVGMAREVHDYGWCDGEARDKGDFYSCGREVALSDQIWGRW